MISDRCFWIDLDAIEIRRDERQRREITGVEELAASLARFGQLNPITITADKVLVTGERRLTAARHLGWPQIFARLHEELSEHDRAAVELEENIKRVDLAWQERVLAIARYHELRREDDPNWTNANTATELGVVQSRMSTFLPLAEALRAGDQTISTAPKLSVAEGLLTRKLARAKHDLLRDIRTTTPIEEPIEGETPQQPAAATPRSVPLYNIDCFEWLREYSGPRFNFLHCDFPYGINFDKQRGQNSANVERYDDSFDTYKRLVEEWLPNAPVADEAHLMFWYSPVHGDYTKLRLIEQGWIINPFPLVWGKSDNSGILPDPKRGPRRNYETAYMASRGDRLIAQAVSNIWWGARGEAQHASVKPKAMLKHFFRMFVDESTVMLDPTCGSGNAIRVGLDMGARLAFGLEANKTYWQDAVDAWDEL